jgi:DnaJ-class molecular chaperone
MIKNYYEILGLSQLATPTEICKAYKTLALQHHPERSAEDKTTTFKMFSDISEAFEVLFDQERKALYDKLGYLKFKNGHTNSNGHFIPGYQFLGNSDEIFESFFGSNNYYGALVQSDSDYEKYLSQKFKVKRAGPKDIEQTVKLSILDIYEGNSFSLTFDREVIGLDGLSMKTQTVTK